MSNNMIKPSEDFNLSFNLTEKENEILLGALNLNSGQSQYQSKVFVAQSQLTPYRMIKQCLLELEARHHAWFNMKTQIKKKLVEIKMINRDIEHSTDELAIEMLRINLEDAENDIRIWNRKLVQSEEELHTYMNLVKEIAKDDEELLQKAYTYDAEEERTYWVTRMAKQAAMDMIAYGRIGSGNMDSIAMMPEEDQIMTLATTLQYNERLTNGLREISSAVNQGLLNNSENLPKFDVPAITDKLLINELLNDVQHTSKSKTKPESI